MNSLNLIDRDRRYHFIELKLYQPMFEQFRHKFPVSDTQWENYTSYFKHLEVPAKTILLNEGEISKKLYLVEKGCLRAWFNNDGKDTSFQFFFENETVASVESFRKKTLSPVTIETIEPSVVWWISKKDLDLVIDEINNIPKLRDQFINAVFERTFDYMKFYLSFIRDSPETRYRNLIQQKPQIIQRVPQHYIASYLGISPVHLSRIKNKLAKKRS